MIKYDPAERDYYIKDLGDGSGTFVKVERNLVRFFLTIKKLKTGYIISFGDTHMLVQIQSDTASGESKILLKFIDGPK